MSTLAHSNSNSDNKFQDRIPPVTGCKRPSSEESVECSCSKQRKQERNVDELLCDYCGDDFVSESYTVYGQEKYHKSCKETCLPQCDKAVVALRTYFNTDVLPFSINVSVLNEPPKHAEGKGHSEKRSARSVNKTTKQKNNLKQSEKQAEGHVDKPTKRKKKLKNLSNKVSAICNSGGGHLVIHIVGLAKGDRHFGYFDEFADKKLEELIQDGRQYAQVYKRQWMCEVPSFIECSEFEGFLTLYIAKAPFLTTSDFKTKFSTNVGVNDPSNQQIYTFIEDQKKESSKEGSSKSDVFHDPGSDLTDLRESSSIQLKGYIPQKGEDVGNLMVTKHRITEYISAFTKLPDGGSYFYGVAEEDRTISEGRPYNTKVPAVKCIEVGDYEEDSLKTKIQNAILVCDFSGEKITDADILRVYFKPSCELNAQCNLKPGRRSDGKLEHGVIHVSTKPVNGIVFYDNEGPIAYKLEEGSMKRVSVKEWFFAIMNRVPPHGKPTGRTNRRSSL